MKRLLLIGLLALTPLAACGDGSIPILNGQSAAQTAPTISADAEKGLTVIHQTYDALGQSLITAAKAGYLFGPNAHTARVLYDKAGLAIDAADAADKAGNETNLLAAIADAKSAMGSAQGLIGSNN